MSLIKETGRVLVKTGISPLFRIKKNGFVMRFYPTKISLILWVDSFYRRSTYIDEELFFRDYLRKGDIVCDIGANVGLYTLVASIAVAEAGKVYAVEAHPKIYRYLQGNIRANKISNVQTFNVALGKEDKVVWFSDKKRDDENAVVADGHGVSVTMTELDSLDIHENHIDLLKIDVEGYEKFVLEGSGATLAKVGCVFFESYDKNCANFNYTSRELRDILCGAGFRIYALRESRLCSLPENYTSPRCENLIALRSEEEFMQRTGYRLVQQDQ